jgi:hypothetical protein
MLEQWMRGGWHLAVSWRFTKLDYEELKMAVKQWVHRLRSIVRRNV